jgi:hypothetical protein
VQQTPTTSVQLILSASSGHAQNWGISVLLAFEKEEKKNGKRKKTSYLIEIESLHGGPCSVIRFSDGEQGVEGNVRRSALT